MTDKLKIKEYTGVEARGVVQVPINLLMSQQEIEGTNYVSGKSSNDRTPGGRGSE